MPRYRKKPIEVEAVQWNCWAEGHPAVELRHIGIAGDDPLYCSHCRSLTNDHGSVMTKQGYVLVCPGDFLITTVDGETYPCKPDVFEASYERVE